MSIPLAAEARRELVDVVGAAGLVTDRELLAAVERDWTGRWVGSATALVRPASTDEVAGVMAWASVHQIALVPQGETRGSSVGRCPLPARSWSRRPDFEGSPRQTALLGS